MKNLTLKAISPQEARKLDSDWNKQQLIEIIDHKQFMWNAEVKKLHEVTKENERLRLLLNQKGDLISVYQKSLELLNKVIK